MCKKFEYGKNSVKVDTGFKSFDKQSNYLGTGNVIANTQCSSYIRPTYELKCNTRNYPARELFEFDIKPFKLSGINEALVEEFADKYNGCILYKFFYMQNKKIQTIGYLLTSKDKKRHSIIGTHTRKRERCINVLLPYLIDKD
jgi:hypothetical protein